ncbi:MAG: hypothetical protein FWH12_01570 [Treponema sp.]|nr:hypothetical protein [Treponema sp.]
MNRIFKISLQIFLFLAIYALAFGARVYWINQKAGLHEDEGISMALSSYREYFWDQNFESNQPYTGQEAQDLSLIPSDISVSSAFQDIGRLWRDSRDPPHTNLYYSFLRLAFINFPSFDMQEAILRGTRLNLIFFTLSFIFFFLFLRHVFPQSKLFQYAGLFCAFLSTAGISNTLFLRPYQLQEALFIIFIFCAVKLMRAEKLPPLIFPLSLITALTLLSGYYAIILVVLFGIYLIIDSIKEGTQERIKFYAVIFGISLVIAQVLYLRYIQGFFSYRATEIPRTLFQFFIDNTLVSFMELSWMMHRHYFALPGILLCVVLFCSNRFLYKKFSFGLPGVVLLISLIYISLAMLSAPYKLLRYAMPMFPFLILIPLCFLESLELQGRKKLFTIAAIAVLCFGFLLPLRDQSKVEHLYLTKGDNYIFIDEPDIPVLIMNRSLWRYADLVPYFNKEQVYYFFDSPDDIFPYLNDYGEVFVIIEMAQPYIRVINNMPFAVDGYPVRFFAHFKLHLPPDFPLEDFIERGQNPGSPSS